MGFRINSAAAAGAIWLSGCAPATLTAGQAIDACSRGARYVEMHDSGVVTRVLGIRRSQNGAHEGFLVRFAGTGRPTRVEDNVDITGLIPLRSSDRIELQGQFECDDDVIHWTHRDPRGRHISGFISVHGQTYR